MSRILNRNALETMTERHDALALMEAGLDAIDTEKVIRSTLSVDGTCLSLQGECYDLNTYKKIKVCGFGKASCKAVQTIENILGKYVAEGIVIDVRGGVCDVVTVEQGSHPRPSEKNVVASRKLVDMAEGSGPDDLVILAVSGGGSSLLCWPPEECDQSIRFFDDAERHGIPISEMNLVRRHLSHVKGGGLAQMLSPATVIALVFCDVPGDVFNDVASGPTYLDATTIADAQTILDRYGLTGYTLHETPKDESLFEKVRNVPLVSNTLALDGIVKEAQRLGYHTVVMGNAVYDDAPSLVRTMREAAAPRTVVLAGGEIRVQVPENSGKSGRCQYLALEAMHELQEGETWLPFASDGIDNTEAAGAIADMQAKHALTEKGAELDDMLARCDSYAQLDAAKALVFTGPTDANVSDIYMLLQS